MTWPTSARPPLRWQVAAAANKKSDGLLAAAQKKADSIVKVCARPASSAPATTSSRHQISAHAC
eukprot:1649518-Prymnesium_polylepis.1